MEKGTGEEGTELKQHKYQRPQGGALHIVWVPRDLAYLCWMLWCPSPRFSFSFWLDGL